MNSETSSEYDFRIAHFPRSHTETVSFTPRRTWLERILRLEPGDAQHFPGRTTFGDFLLVDLRQQLVIGSLYEFRIAPRVEGSKGSRIQGLAYAVQYLPPDDRHLVRIAVDYTAEWEDREPGSPSVFREVISSSDDRWQPFKFSHQSNTNQ